MLADKAYSARAHRQLLRARGITAVIPEPAYQIGQRNKRGSRGDRPVAFDADRYRGRNVVERGFNPLENWRGLATRHDKHVVIYRGGMVLAAALTCAQRWHPETVRPARRLLKEILDVAVEDDLLLRNPATDKRGRPPANMPRSG